MPNAINLDLQPSAACVSLVERSEGLELTAYSDQGAYSIGYGHRGVPEGSTCTLEQANTWLESDLAEVAAEIKSLVNVPLTQGQFDGLCDFTFELGSGRLEHSTLLKMLNHGQYAQIPTELEKWIYVGGSVSDGLISRRQAEVALWNS